MKKITTLLSILLTVFCLINKTKAQEDYFNCGTTQATNEVLEANPQKKEAFLKLQQEYALQDKIAFENGYQNESRAAAQVYIIPVVFHILHQGGSENISDAQINDAMRILNEDFRKKNTDISQVVTAFKNITADCEIEFRLAKKTPTGASTTGIDRINTPLTNSADDNSKLNYWPCEKYLNIWVAKTIGKNGVAGYSRYPGVADEGKDGVLILHSYVGSVGTGTKSHSRALTHEVGHWLNLPHTWGSTNDPGIECGDDDVSDTPITKGHKSCPASDATCKAGVLENIQNYMEYSYCCKMYTAGQKNRMRAALNNPAGGRNNIWTSDNLKATGITYVATLSNADFKSNQIDNAVCQGNSLTFTDLSWNGIPTTYSWTFQGGIPSTSSASSPTITYNTPGIYNVSLTVSNSSGSASATKTGFIRVYKSSATVNTTSYEENFEGGAIPNSNWQVNNLNSGSNTWTQTNTANATAGGSKCLYIVNATNADGQIDELISPSIDMTKILYAPSPSPYLSFDFAYAQKNATNNDALEVLVSTDCGTTWTMRESMKGTELSTTGTLINSSFTPNSLQWKGISTNLGPYKSSKNLYVMFRFKSNMGNNIYLDNIFMGQRLGLEEDLSQAINLNIYPNPIDGSENSIISFNLLNNEKVDISVYDVFGRKTSSIFSGYLNSGDHKFNINSNELAAGVYFVKIAIAETYTAKKIIVR